MRIFGDSDTTVFNNHIKEAGWFWGHNDVLSGGELTRHVYVNDMFGERTYDTKIYPKLYLHIANSAWSTFTGMLREYFLPWRWDTVYLDNQDGSPLQKALVCTSESEGKISSNLKEVIGKSSLVASLIQKGQYVESLGNEFLWLRMPSHTWQDIRKTCHIMRIRSPFSFIDYYFLKFFSSNWKEVTLRTEHASETVLIRKESYELISSKGLIES